MVKIKFCGMTNLDDCRRAVDLGGGLRRVRLLQEEQARRHARQGEADRRGARRQGGDGRRLRGGGRSRRYEEIVGLLRPRLRPGVPGVGAAERDQGAPRRRQAARRGPATGLILFDSDSEGVGGSGRPFDLSLLEGLRRPSTARSSREGSTRAMVGGRPPPRALRHRPGQLDRGVPGKKDHRKMERFVEKVRGFQIMKRYYGD